MNQAVICSAGIHSAGICLPFRGTEASPSSVEDICVQELNCESWLLYLELYVEVSIQL